MAKSVIEVRDLTVRLNTPNGTITPVDSVSFSIDAGRTLGLVGESGCGKSMTAMSIVRLLPHGIATRASGSVLFDGQDLAKMSDVSLRDIRGRRIGVIFQEPMTALNPAFTIADQVGEPLRLHLKMPRRAARARVAELLELVGIHNPKRVMDDYPHQLSGGMRQRVMIAMAMGCEPDLLIADEPTTALDVTTQAQILDLMLDLQQERGTALLMITHDLGVVAQTCDDVVVMYCGSVVEQGPILEVFDHPTHPYTIGLMESLPSYNDGRSRLHYIKGAVPGLGNLPRGCRFAPRCAQVRDDCLPHPPALLHLPDNREHSARCVLIEDRQKGAAPHD